MRSHRNDAGQILLVLPSEVVRPLRNALQKLAGGVDFFALDEAERGGLDEALRHLWNPGEDQQGSRDRTVPIEVLALAMKDRRAAKLAEAALSRVPAASRAQINRDDVEDQRRELPTIPPPGVGVATIAAIATKPAARAASALATSLAERPTVELAPHELPASPSQTAPRPAPAERASATKSDGYRAPTKGRHTDVSR